MNATEDKKTKGSVQSTIDPSGLDSKNPARLENGEGKLPKEIGGRDGPEPTRFGDWEKNGRCIDF
ncbi:MAG: DUF1674 domain-containing protein [Gammaproteobacteria bacterium]|nr:DUF1674 domain-containing protein [Gammaproteobacteria bacterium]NNJ79324.1 DUF1674 domain-containing protein [Xanthomonadales bacterium]